MESIENANNVDPLVLLFDIDGTLIDSSGAGGGALRSALMRVFGISDARPVQLQGRTDFGIMTELLETHGIEATPRNLEKLCAQYYEILPASLEQRTGRVLPGVEQLLDELNTATECHLGLLTGNMPTSARFKLQHYGLWERFAFGIFGDQAMHRRELSGPAIDMVREEVRTELPSNRVVIIGDTPMDVELAVAMSARSLAVCTGGVPHESLRAAGADKVVPDLSDTAAILHWCLQPARSPL